MQPEGAPQARAGTAPQPVSNQAASDYYFGQRMMPYFDQYLPDKALPVRHRLNQILQNVTAGETRDRLQSVSSAQTIQDLLDQADLAVATQQKDGLYMRALMQALNEGGYEQAISIAGKLSDKERRNNFEETARYRAATAAVSRGEFERAYSYSEKLTKPSFRATALDQLARALADQKQTDRATEIMNEALGLIGKADESFDKARITLQLAGTAVWLDRLRGFEVTKTAIETINRADRLTRTDSAEVKPGAPSILSLDFGQTLPLLAREDFDRALLLSQLIERKEVSIRAQLAVCRGVLLSSRTREPARKSDGESPGGQKPAPRDKPRKEQSRPVKP